MPTFEIKLDTSDFEADIEAARQKDIPFATALTLTRCAQDGQIEVRRDVAQKFKLRNTWTQTGIRITPAQKVKQPYSEVYTDTANSTTGAPDYLIKQEDGGEKVPFGGRSHIAIPTKYLRQYAPGVIPDPLRPRNLLPADAGIGSSYKGRFDGPSTAGRFNRISRAGFSRLGSKEFAAFLQYDRAGTLCVFVRRGGTRDAEPWYILVPDATIRAVLGMEKTVAKVVDDRFETHWDDAWDSIRSRG